MKEAGLHIIDAIDKIIQMPPNIPKDSICPYCNSEDTFPIVKNETEIKTKDTVWGAGAVECVCSVRLDYCAERFSRALK